MKRVIGIALIIIGIAAPVALFYISDNSVGLFRSIVLGVFAIGFGGNLIRESLREKTDNGLRSDKK